VQASKFKDSHLASPGCGAKVTLEIRRARGNSRARTTAERTSTGYYERGIRPKRPDVHAAVVLNDRSLDPIRELFYHPFGIDRSPLDISPRAMGIRASRRGRDELVGALAN
jgi:hypothetical protein